MVTAHTIVLVIVLDDVEVAQPLQLRQPVRHFGRLIIQLGGSGGGNGMRLQGGPARARNDSKANA